jgi:hypothetical protein
MNILNEWDLIVILIISAFCFTTPVCRIATLKKYRTLEIASQYSIGTFLEIVAGLH